MILQDRWICLWLCWLFHSFLPDKLPAGWTALFGSPPWIQAACTLWCMGTARQMCLGRTSLSETSWQVQPRSHCKQIGIRWYQLCFSFFLSHLTADELIVYSPTQTAARSVLQVLLLQFIFISIKTRPCDCRFVSFLLTWLLTTFRNRKPYERVISAPSSYLCFQANNGIRLSRRRWEMRSAVVRDALELMGSSWCFHTLHPY